MSNFKVGDKVILLADTDSYKANSEVEIILVQLGCPTGMEVAVEGDLGDINWTRAKNLILTTELNKLLYV